MIPISDNVRLVIGIIAGLASVATAIITVFLEKNISYRLRLLLSKNKGGKPPSEVSPIVWILYSLAISISVLGAGLASSLPTSVPASSQSLAPTFFPTNVLTNKPTALATSAEIAITPPLVFPIASDGELMLIVADFTNHSDGQITGINPAQRISTLLEGNLPGLRETIIVRRYHEEISSDEEAMKLLKTYNGTLLIWGWYDAVSVVTRVIVSDEWIASELPVCKVFDLGTPEDVITSFTEDVPANASYVAFLALGILEYREGNNESAFGFFNKAIDAAKLSTSGKINPSSAWAWRGYTYSDKLNNHQQAIDELTEAINLNPLYADYYSVRADIFVKLKKYDQAIEDYSTAINLMPEYSCYYAWRGDIYFDLGNYEEAIVDYNADIKLDPKDTYWRMKRGDAYLALGNNEKAFASFKEAIIIDPHDSSLYQWRGKAYYATAEYKKALDDFNQAIKLEPNNADYYTWRGYAWTDDGNYEKAIKDHSEAIKLDPQASRYANRGDVYSWYLKEYEKAIIDYTIAISIKPDTAVFYKSRGNAYKELGKFKDAIIDYRKYLELIPSDDPSRKEIEELIHSLEAI